MKKEVVGKITRFFPNINVAVVSVQKPMRVGDTISIEGHGVEFKQKIASMQIEHKSLSEAKPGDDIGMKVDQAVKEGDIICRITEEKQEAKKEPKKKK